LRRTCAKIAESIATPCLSPFASWRSIAAMAEESAFSGFSSISMLLVEDEVVMLDLAVLVDEDGGAGTVFAIAWVPVNGEWRVLSNPAKQHTISWGTVQLRALLTDEILDFTENVQQTSHSAVINCRNRIFMNHRKVFCFQSGTRPAAKQREQVGVGK
jgi:hypothetical protein